MSLLIDFHIAHKERVSRMWCASSKISVAPPIPQRSYIAPSVPLRRARKALPAADHTIGGIATAWRMEHGVTLPRRLPSFRALVSLTSEATGVSVTDILGRHRSDRIARARHIIMYIMRHYKGMTYPEIGRLFRMNHSTIIHGANKVRERRKFFEPEVSHLTAFFATTSPDVKEVPFE